MINHQDLLKLSTTERYEIAMMLLDSLKSNFNIVQQSESINQDKISDNNTNIPSSELISLINEVMEEYTSEDATTNKQKYHAAGGFEALDKIEYRLKKRYSLG
jgi:hypothetical protein